MEKASDSSSSDAEVVFKKTAKGPGKLYVIMDAARDSKVVEHAQDSGVMCRSLFEGPVGRELEGVAPHQAEFRTKSSVWPWWFQQWGRSLGVIVETPTSFEELRRHFRTLLIVRHEDGQKYFFRFYDPRVLRVFLPNCSAGEVRRFFGPVTAFYCEGEQGAELLKLTPSSDGIEVTRSPVKTGPGRVVAS
jgi:hypothetical protein